MVEIAHRRVPTNSIHLHIAEAGQGLPIILLHGFSELWYSWRYQIPALAEAGYLAIAPDLRGYGQSDAPEGVENYTMRIRAGDVIGLLDNLGAEQGVLIGLDWRERLAWWLAQAYPQRVAAFVVLSLPFFPRSDRPPLEAIKQQAQGKFSIVEYFQEPGVAEAELGQGVRRSMVYFLATLYGGSPPDLLRKLYLAKPNGSRLRSSCLCPTPGSLPANC